MSRENNKAYQNMILLVVEYITKLERELDCIYADCIAPQPKESQSEEITEGVD